MHDDDLLSKDLSPVPVAAVLSAAPAVRVLPKAVVAAAFVVSTSLVGCAGTPASEDSGTAVDAGTYAVFDARRVGLVAIDLGPGVPDSGRVSGDVGAPGLGPIQFGDAGETADAGPTDAGAPND